VGSNPAIPTKIGRCFCRQKHRPAHSALERVPDVAERDKTRPQAGNLICAETLGKPAVDPSDTGAHRRRCSAPPVGHGKADATPVGRVGLSAQVAAFDQHVDELARRLLG
jgi:hypothetical protein